MFCSHLARSLIQNVTLAAEEEERKGSEGSGESSVLCLKRELSVCVALILFTAVRASTHKDMFGYTVETCEWVFHLIEGCVSTYRHRDTSDTFLTIRTTC